MQVTQQSQGRFWRVWKWPLHWQILGGLILGAVLGLSLGHWAVGRAPDHLPSGEVAQLAEQTVTQSAIYTAVELLGDLFLRGLKVIVVPLVVSSIVLAVAGLGATKEFGRLGIKTLTYYMATSLLAILIGLTLIDLVHPGINGDGVGILQGRDLSAFADSQAAVAARTAGKSAGDFLDIFRKMVPENMVQAAVENDLLALIVVAIIGGFFLAHLADPVRSTTLHVLEAIYEISLKAAGFVLLFAPIGVLGLVAATFSVQYARLAPDDRFAEFIAGIGLFAAVAFAALCVHALIVLPAMVSLVARISPIRLYRAMAPALITAFSTASSSATLPLTLSCVEKRAGVSNRIASFTLPLGATVNMDGTALYECVAAIFICQSFGIDLAWTQQFMIVLTALLTSIGVAGVPAASLVAIVVILQAVQAQLPQEAPALLAGLGLLFVFDRPLDMCRTAVNVFSDSCGAVVIGRSEGETAILQDTRPEPQPAEVCSESNA